MVYAHLVSRHIYQADHVYPRNLAGRILFRSLIGISESGPILAILLIG